MGWARTASVAFLVGVFASPAFADDASARPFGPGETLEYKVSLGGLTGKGLGTLKVLRTAPIAGEPVELLQFDIDVRLGFQRLEHHARSWLSAARFASLRYEVTERNPFARSEEQVSISPDDRRWQAGPEAGVSPTSEPLDELSFIYFLRTLPLTPGSYTFDRHYDARRNPVTVKILGHEEVSIGDRKFNAARIEMRVNDPKHFGGEAVLRFLLSDDPRRIPLRIELPSPLPAPLVLELQRSTHEATP